MLVFGGVILPDPSQLDHLNISSPACQYAPQSVFPAPASVGYGYMHHIYIYTLDMAPSL